MSDSLSNFLVPRNIWNPSHMRFFCHFYRMLIILFVLVYTLSSFIDTFQSEHQRCSVSKPNISFHPSFACEDLPYVLYFRSLIESSSTILQYRLIAKRVLSMYSDLSKNLIPLTLDLNYIRKNLPRYYSSLSNSTNSDQRMLSIHPISFGIPEDKIAIQVPPKNKTFSTVIPGDKTTYVDDETIYYQELQKSIFTFTYKKAGWDCQQLCGCYCMKKKCHFLDSSSSLTIILFHRLLPGCCCWYQNTCKGFCPTFSDLGALWVTTPVNRQQQILRATGLQEIIKEGLHNVKISHQQP